MVIIFTKQKIHIKKQEYMDSQASSVNHLSLAAMYRKSDSYKP